VVLLLLELLIFPGTAILGITGACLVLWALLTAMAGDNPQGDWWPSFPDLRRPLLNLSFAVVMSGVGAVLAARFLPKSRAFNSRLVLSSSTSAAKGYTSTAPGQELVGLQGVTVTALRPGGAAMFGDRRIDVVTRGEFLNADTRVVIVEAHGMRIVVEAARSGGAT
jgi:membrane-bound serine protease (ClpP class)